MKVRLTLKSANKKTGPIPVSTTVRASCPPTCAWYEKGCYALSGPLSLVWKQVENVGMEWPEFCAAIAALPVGQLWRHNQAGDLPGEGTEIDVKALAALVKANKGRRGFTYTHKPMMTATARKSVQVANESGFTINLSADSLAQADQLAALNIAPVTVVRAQGAPRTERTPGGLHVIQCPAEYSELSCASCGLCAIATRKSVIGFTAHGAHAKVVSEKAKGADNGPG